MKKIRSLFLLMLLVAPILVSGCADTGRKKAKHKTTAVAILPDKLKLKITVGDQTVTAFFVDSQTTRDFIKLLPLTLSMSDINHREKYSGLSDKLSAAGDVKTTYQIGDLSYWLGGGIAAFYNQDGRQVKAGLIVLAKLEKNIALFNVAGSVKVTFDVTEN